MHHRFGNKSVRGRRAEADKIIDVFPDEYRRGFGNEDTRQCDDDDDDDDTLCDEEEAGRRTRDVAPDVRLVDPWDNVGRVEIERRSEDAVGVYITKTCFGGDELRLRREDARSAVPYSASMLQDRYVMGFENVYVPETHLDDFEAAMRDDVNATGVVALIGVETDCCACRLTVTVDRVATAAELCGVGDGLFSGFVRMTLEGIIEKCMASMLGKEDDGTQCSDDDTQCDDTRCDTQQCSNDDDDEDI